MSETTLAEMNSAAIRNQLIDILVEDLIGPLDGRSETLDVAPSRFYLTGFLASCNGTRQVEKPPETGAALPFEIPQDEDDEDAPEDPSAKDEAPDPGARKVGRLPSSLGLSLLLAPGTTTLMAEASWADYNPVAEGETIRWERQYHQERLEIPLTQRSGRRALPNANGLELHWAQRPFNTEGSGLEQGTLSVAVFLVNAKPPQDGPRDLEFVFQATLALEHPAGFIPRPDWHARTAEERDARIADLQYRDDREWAVGHGVAAEARLDADGRCRRLETAWVPYADVEKVEPAIIPDVELQMEALADAADLAGLITSLLPLVHHYSTWISEQHMLPVGDPEREATKDDLVQQMQSVCTRIQKGIDALNDPLVLKAFQLANRAMATAARQRASFTGGAVSPPTWRPFQLAFILMALPGLVDPADADRNTVDLLFFPTGGGKTEAYLGLAAITLLYRRFKHPEISGAGVSVLMRYTLRLLTLDQLGRATALICALELMRKADPNLLGHWPFEMGLWIGQGGTPNRLGKKGDANEHSAYARLRRHLDDPKRHGAPLPLAVCPWCDTPFQKTSYVLEPATEPRRLRVRCGNLKCAFGLEGLPLVGVDEEIYRRLPGFIIATVDKFAALPWEGRAGTLFGLVERRDAEGFYGPCDEGYGMPLPAKHLPPPELIIQDELHLISGPLGTMVGLYEAAIEELCLSQIKEGPPIRPKIVASTATVRRAEAQIQGLFGRSAVTIFPPPGPDRRDSFFAVTKPASEVAARRYIGISARGRSFKVVQLRVGIALLAAAASLYKAHAGKSGPNPVDPYMTLLAYFGSLRELGGARRIYEDEVKKRVAAYGSRTKNLGAHRPFTDRDLGEIGELTSRVSTAEIAEAKDRLSREFASGRSLDVALATNMIAVGLDISRLGLMIVTGQPISTSEYIQATSRVGRDANRPGLVVTLFNPMRPRDRSHYERFGHFHRTYYRQVETTSVTPFSLRALDRGLAGALVGLIRHAEPGFAKPDGFMRARHASGRLKVYAQRLSKRAASMAEAQEIETRIQALIDDWDGLATDLQGVSLYYNKSEARGGSVLGVLHDPLAPVPEGLPVARGKKFRAQRSLRDVEAVSNVWLKVIGQRDYVEDDHG